MSIKTPESQCITTQIKLALMNKQVLFFFLFYFFYIIHTSQTKTKI